MANDPDWLPEVREFSIDIPSVKKGGEVSLRHLK